MQRMTSAIDDTIFQIIEIEPPIDFPDTSDDDGIIEIFDEQFEIFGIDDVVDEIKHEPAVDTIDINLDDSYESMQNNENECYQDHLKRPKKDSALSKNIQNTVKNDKVLRKINLQEPVNSFQFPKPAIALNPECTIRNDTKNILNPDLPSKSGICSKTFDSTKGSKVHTLKRKRKNFFTAILKQCPYCGIRLKQTKLQKHKTQYLNTGKCTNGDKIGRKKNSGKNARKRITKSSKDLNDIENHVKKRNKLNSKSRIVDKNTDKTTSNVKIGSSFSDKQQVNPEKIIALAENMSIENFSNAKIKKVKNSILNEKSSLNSGGQISTNTDAHQETTRLRTLSSELKRSKRISDRNNRSISNTLNNSDSNFDTRKRKIEDSDGQHNKNVNDRSGTKLIRNLTNKFDNFDKTRSEDKIQINGNASSSFENSDRNLISLSAINSTEHSVRDAPKNSDIISDKNHTISSNGSSNINSIHHTVTRSTVTSDKNSTNDSMNSDRILIKNSDETSTRNSGRILKKNSPINLSANSDKNLIVNSAKRSTRRSMKNSDGISTRNLIKKSVTNLDNICYSKSTANLHTESSISSYKNSDEKISAINSTKNSSVNSKGKSAKTSNYTSSRQQLKNNEKMKSNLPQISYETITNSDKNSSIPNGILESFEDSESGEIDNYDSNSSYSIKNSAYLMDQEEGTRDINSNSANVSLDMTKNSPLIRISDRNQSKVIKHQSNIKSTIMEASQITYNPEEPLPENPEDSLVPLDEISELYKCKECQKLLKSKAALCSHIVIVHSSGRRKRKGKGMRKNLNRLKKRKNCVKCGAPLQNIKNIKHICPDNISQNEILKIKNENVRNICYFCKEDYVNSYDLLKHINRFHLVRHEENIL